ncbi:MAG: hypothetical protein QXJ17_01170 [Nitrososphaeria archaeon]
MNSKKEVFEEDETAVKSIKYSTTYNLSAAVLIWLFGVLVFIPIADTINVQTRLFVNLIVFIPFTILLLKAVPRVKRLLEVFAVVLAKKFKFMEVKEDEQIIVFKKFLHMMFIIVVYLFYFPFLNNFHPAINGIVLIVALLWNFFLLFGILQIALNSKMK